MPNFTNDALFDDTLPAGDGRLEVDLKVPPDRLQGAMEELVSPQRLSET